MYRRRLRDWGAFKNLKRNEKARLLSLQNQSKANELERLFLSPAIQKKLARHVRAMTVSTRRNPRTDGSPCPQSADTASAELIIGALRKGRPQGEPTNPNSRDAHALIPHRHVDLEMPNSYSQMVILASVMSLYSAPTTLNTWTGRRSRAWSLMDQGIYLLKVRLPHRAWPTISQACDLLARENLSGCKPAEFAMELLTTLSAVNMAVCPELRRCLLAYLGGLVTHRAPRHPISLIARALLANIPEKQQRQQHRHADGATIDIDEAALTCLVDTLRAGAPGSVRSIAATAQNRLTAMLRRAGRHERAVASGRRALEVVTTLQGCESERARKAARTVSRVLVDMGRWVEALEACRLVLGHVGEENDGRGGGGGLPICSAGLAFRDRCAIHAMQDVAEIYVATGERGKAAAWLMEAARSSSVLGSSEMETVRIVDKLNAVLIESGRAEDVVVWSRFAAVD